MASEAEIVERMKKASQIAVSVIGNHGSHTAVAIMTVKIYDELKPESEKPQKAWVRDP